MAQQYRAVPLDEEQNRSSSEFTLYKKGRLSTRLEDDKFEKDVRTRVLDFAFKHCAWIGHVALLSLSMTFFILSIYNRTARPSDLQVTQQFSSYCMPSTSRCPSSPATS